MQCTSTHNVSSATFNQPELVEQLRSLSPVLSTQTCCRRCSFSTVASIVTSNGSNARLVQPSKYLPRAGPRPFSPVTYPLVMSEAHSSTDQPFIDGANAATFCQPTTPLPLEGFESPQNNKPQSTRFFSLGSYRRASDTQENETYLCSRFSACSSSIASKNFEPHTTLPPSITPSTPRKTKHISPSNRKQDQREDVLSPPINTTESTFESRATCSPQNLERIRRWLADTSTYSCTWENNIAKLNSPSPERSPH